MRRILSCGVAAAVTLIGCNLVVGIEDVTPGAACDTAADCTVADACTAATCEAGVCATSPMDDGTTCGDPGQACSAGACVCPETNACGPAGECVDTATDPDHCGTCGHACGPAETCDAGACVCAPQNQCGDACIDTSSTPTDCGECGHDCLGQACIGGVCEPIVVLTGQPFPASMVDDGPDLYYTLGGGPVRRVPKAGGTPIDLGDGGAFGPYGIALDTDNVYWTSFDAAINAVLTVPKAGGITATLAGTEDYPGTIYQADGTLYWSTIDGIRSFVLPTGPAMDFALAQVGGHAVDAQFVYYTVVDELFRQPRAGGPPESLATGLANPSAVAVDAQNAYVILGTTEEQQAANERVGSVVRVSKTPGGTVTPLAEGLASPRGIRVDATHVYYTDEIDLGAWRVSKGGGASVPVAKGFDVLEWMVVTDDDFIYLGDVTNDRIVKVPK